MGYSYSRAAMALLVVGIHHHASPRIGWCRGCDVLVLLLVPLVVVVVLVVLLPHGLGIAVPVAPVLPLLVVVRCVGCSWGCVASIIGSWTLRYMLESAAKPPGMFSNCDMAKSC